VLVGTSIKKVSTVSKDLVGLGTVVVPASMAAPGRTKVHKSTIDVRRTSSQISLVAPGVELTPQFESHLSNDVEMKSPRPAPVRVGGKKIRKACDPSHGATYQMMKDTMSSIRVHSSVSNGRLRRKRVVDDDDSVVIGRKHTGRNQVNTHGRREADDDGGGAGAGSVVSDVRGSQDIWGIRRIRTEWG